MPEQGVIMLNPQRLGVDERAYAALEMRNAIAEIDAALGDMLRSFRTYLAAAGAGRGG